MTLFQRPGQCFNTDPVNRTGPFKIHAVDDASGSGSDPIADDRGNFMSGKGRHNPMGHIESGHLNQIHVLAAADAYVVFESFLRTESIEHFIDAFPCAPVR
jgi:hypothetical protein